jgi:hypothetical protein
MTETPETLPSPGSAAALARGCKCPILDNNHGEFPPHQPDQWWVHPRCPLHGFGRGEPVDVELPGGNG